MLQDLVTHAATRCPEAPAIHGPDRALNYAELDSLAEAIAAELRALGVGPGDRVALLAPKSAAVVGAMQGVLRVGAAYVPLDPTAPLARLSHILRDSGCRALASTAERLAELEVEVPLVSLAPGEVDRRAALGMRSAPSDSESPDDLAYVLYTSGSTGVPKGVCISHRNALSFVRWAAEHVGLTGKDRLAGHAPFHFDLSVFDLYAAFAVGACTHIVDETAAYAPARLVRFVEERAISVWYSVPSALMLMVDDGGLLDAAVPALRTVIFAGEVYPTPHVRTLRRGLPEVRLFNFYGPTETNVCTAYEVASLAEDETRAVPIGTAASGDTLEIRGPDGSQVPDGSPGELWVQGPSVMLGYWGKPPQRGAYATGDLVLREADGNLRFLGRLDHQVKVRGYRIELLEIEAVLAADPRIKEVCVRVEGTGMRAKLVAYAVATDRPASIIALKRTCAQHLPKYMIIDAVHYLPALPRTGNGKVDRAALGQAHATEERA